MKAIMVMFDSLNRRLLGPYGCDWVKTPNFDRLAQKAVVFDNFYAGSLPCMPARRDLHTGRYSFLHRSWGPLEPFDNSMPELLKRHGVYTRLVSDHGHYWEDGGCTYHTRYSTWDCVRGQEADPWSFRADEPDIPEHVPTMREFTHPEWWRDSWCNKELIHKTGKWPQNLVFDKGVEFLECNKNIDNWFIQIECFDPHEPFDSPQEFRNLYPDSYAGPHFDWPPYAPVSETCEQIEHIRKRYAALVSQCDQNLGRILDLMDAHNLWKDTMLIVNTDHGFMLGEKDWWAKSVMPCYNELANTPFFLWDPRSGCSNVRRSALCQTIDIAPTLLDFFGAPVPPEMQGIPLDRVAAKDEKIRDCALFGFHGSFVNITDAKHVYMRSSASLSNTPLYEYTLMPAHQQCLFTPTELENAEICPPFKFMKKCKVLKIPVGNKIANATFCNSFQYGNLLFDLTSDPQQLYPSDDPDTEAQMVNALVNLMKKSEAPAEQFERLGLKPDAVYDSGKILEDRKQTPSFEDFALSGKFEWSADAKNIFIGMLSLIPQNQTNAYLEFLERDFIDRGVETVSREDFIPATERFYAADRQKIFYFLNKLSRIR